MITRTVHFGIIGFVCLCTLFSSLAGAALIPSDTVIFEGDAWYFDSYFNKQLDFQIKGNEIIVRFESLPDASTLTVFASSNGLETLNSINPHYYHARYRVSDRADLLAECNRISNLKGVISAYPVLMGSDGYHKPVIGHELTVRFHDYMSESRCLEVISGMGSEVTEDHWTPGYYTVSVPSDQTLFEAIRATNARSEVRFAEFSLIGFNDYLFTPNDPDFVNQQNLNNTGQVGSCNCPPYNTHDLRAVEAWEITRGNPDVVVSIIDTGMDVDHPDLVGNLLDRGDEDWNFASASSSDPDDTQGHGTSCSGIAAGVTDNGAGIAGIANQCSLMPLKIDLSSGLNQNRADALNYAASRRPDFAGLVLSNSWRMSSGDYTAVYDAIENAYNSGCVVVFAAGNEDQSPVEVPGDSEFCICVSAVSPCDERKSTSSCDGESFWGSSYGPSVDVAAPGVLIHTTAMDGGYTDTFNGTSSACPHVAGAAALILSLAPNLSPAEVQSILENGADDLGTAGWDQYFGWGRINLLESLNLVSGVYLDKTSYQCADTAEITVRDNGAPGPTVNVTVSSGTESGGEMLVLQQDTVDLTLFAGNITVTDSPAVPGDGAISITDGDTIQVTYAALGKMDSASVDCSVPVISGVTVDLIGYDTATISWTTDELTNSVVMYGTDLPEEIAQSDDLTTEHAMTLEGLIDCTEYIFYVSSADAAGNTATDDNGGMYYDFVTYELVVLFEEMMDSDPMWEITGGDWEWGIPQGNDGDPISGYTGDNVYGYNLDGTYTNGLPAYYLVTPAFDCTGASQVFFSFYRWLGVESSTWDHAAVSVSGDNGDNWTVLWENGSSMTDTSWAFQEFDISAVAGGASQVKIRWQMGTTDSSVIYCGWNIDDVMVSYSLPCENTCVNHGDVNLDGTITAGDAQLTFQIALGSYTPTPEEGCAADCNGDGEVTSGDAQGVFAAALGSGSCADPLE